MQRTLWGRNTSSNVMKVIWLLAELDLPYERIDVGGPFGQTGTPDYRAMNPTGLVPTLQEGDFVLWESNAIMRYLASGHARGAPIWPDDLGQRARIDRWLDCQQTRLNRPQSLWFQGVVRTPPADRDAAAIARAVQEAGAAYALIEPELGRHPYIAGEHLTLADIAWGIHVHRWFTLPIERTEMPNLRAWYERLKRRPEYEAYCGRAIV